MPSSTGSQFRQTLVVSGLRILSPAVSAEANPQFASGTLVRRILDSRQFFSMEKDPLTHQLWARDTAHDRFQLTLVYGRALLKPC